MKKVLVRYYNRVNLGDDLFVKILCDRYNDIFSVVSSSKSLKSNKNIKLYNSKLIQYIFRFLEIVLHKNNLFLSYLSKSNDLLVYIGGSIFIEDKKEVWDREVNFYKNLNIPYYIVGPNVGPYNNESFLHNIRQVVNGSEDICFRDENSYGLFSDLKPSRLSTDAVFTLDKDPYLLVDNKIVVFSIIDCTDRLGKQKTDYYENKIIEMTNRLVGDGYSIVYASFCKFEGDENAINRIVDKLDNGSIKSLKIVNYDGSNLNEIINIFSNCELVVATRFHAVVMGLLFSKKVLPITYSNKTRSLLDDVDFKEKIIDIKEMNDIDFRYFRFDLIKKHNPKDQILLAQSQFKVLDKILNKRV